MDNIGTDIFTKLKEDGTDFHDDDDDCEEESLAEENNSLLVHNNIMLKTLCEFFSLQKIVDKKIDEAVRETEEKDQTIQ